MRCQLCFRLVELSALKLRVTCFELRFSQWSVQEEYDLQCSGRLWFSSSLGRLIYADKRGDFNFDFSSVLKKLKATHGFTTAIAKAQNYVSLFLKIGLFIKSI